MFRLRTAKEAFLSVLSVLYIFITAMWLTPETELRKRVVEPIRSFWLFWGLEQSWALFSPVIRNINYHTVGIVTFKDGNKKVWELPRMEKLDLFQRFKKEKFRKWGVDSLPWPSHKEFWPCLARYVGREQYAKDNPPVQFSLILYWSKIPIPGKEFVPTGANPPHTDASHIFTYDYSEEDFR